MNQPKPRRTSRRKSRHNRADQSEKHSAPLRATRSSKASNVPKAEGLKPEPLKPERSMTEASSRTPEERAVTIMRPEISAITHYLAHESALLDLIAIALYQHLIESYGTELDQEMTSETILTTLRNWAGEQCDRRNLWTQTAKDMSWTIVSQALQSMQRDLDDRVLESLDWGEFNQILFQYMFEYPAVDLKERLMPLEESYAQQLAQRIIQEMDLGNQSISLLKRRLGLASQQEAQPSTLVRGSLSDVSPIAELASELPLLVQEENDGNISFSDQFQSDLWSSDARAVAYLRYHAKQNRHQYLEHYITSPRDIKALPWELVEQIRLKFGLNAAKLQFLLAAYATQYPRWDQAFTLTAANLIEALGWPNRHANGHSSGVGNPARDNVLKTKAANLLYALSCVLVKLVWVDYKKQNALDMGEAASAQPQQQAIHPTIGPFTGPKNQSMEQVIGRSPVGKLWDVIIAPQGIFERQSGEIESASTVLLTIRPGLWVELLDGGYNPPSPSMGMAFRDGSNQSLNQFGAMALCLLQLDAYRHDLTIRLVIYLMLDAVCHTEDTEIPVYTIKSLLGKVSPEAIALSQTNIKQGQKLFEDWNITLGILIQLIHSSDRQNFDRRDIVSDIDPTSLYVLPYPKWLNPQTSIRKPRGWVQMWLSQKVKIPLMS